MTIAFDVFVLAIGILVGYMIHALKCQHKAGKEAKDELIIVEADEK